jgi:hypothetical protein
MTSAYTCGFDSNQPLHPRHPRQRLTFVNG